MNAQETARAVLAENGDWMVGQMGSDGLDDLIWDVHPTYSGMPPEERATFREAVGTELFG